MSDSKRNNDNLPFGDLIKSMNHYFHEKPIKGFLQTIDDFFTNPFPAPSFQVERSETDTEYIVMAKLPGIKKEQIQLEIYDRNITITVHHEEKVSEKDTNKQLLNQQHSVQRASRIIPFPYPINDKKIKASYENGLLQIKIAKPKGKRISLD